MKTTFGLTLKVEADCHTENLSKHFTALHEAQSPRNFLNCLSHEDRVTDHLKVNPHWNQNASKVQEITSYNLLLHIIPISCSYHIISNCQPLIQSSINDVSIYFTNFKTCETSFVWTVSQHVQHMDKNQLKNPKTEHDKHRKPVTEDVSSGDGRPPVIDDLLSEFAVVVSDYIV